MNYHDSPHHKTRRIYLLTLLFIFSQYVLGYSSESKKPPFSTFSEKSAYFYSGSYLPAQMIWLNESFFSISVENRYCLTELTDKNLSAGVYLKGHLLLFRLAHFGYGKMGNLNFNLGYYRQFSRKFAAGLQFYYLLDHAYQYPSTHSCTIEAFGSFFLTDKLRIGLSIFNPIALKYGFTGELIPLVFKSEIYYKIGRNCSIWFFLIKEQPGQLLCQGGINIAIKNSLLTVSAGNRNCSLAFSLPYRKFIFQLKSEYSFRLGYSPMFAGAFTY